MAFSSEDRSSPTQGTFSRASADLADGSDGSTGIPMRIVGEIHVSTPIGLVAESVPSGKPDIAIENGHRNSWFPIN